MENFFCWEPCAAFSMRPAREAGYCVITKAQKVENPNTCQKVGTLLVTRKLSRREASRDQASGRVGFRFSFKNAILQAARVRGSLRHASACTSDAVRQGAGRTDRAQQPAARGGGSSLSVAAATPREPRQPRAPRQPQDAGGGPRRGSPSVADGTRVAASTAPRQPPASGSLAAAEHRQPWARAAVAATATERRRRANIAATAAERRRPAVAAATRGPGRR